MEMDEVVNSCRVCRSANQDGEFECLYVVQVVEQHGIVQSGTWQLTEAGKLYEEMFGIEIDGTTMEVYPQYLCNSCDLQMRLFRKLTLKARRTLEVLAQFHATTDDSAKEKTKVEATVTPGDTGPHKFDMLADGGEFEEHHYLESTSKQFKVSEVHPKLEAIETDDDEMVQQQEEVEDDEDEGAAHVMTAADTTNNDLQTLAEHSDNASDIYIYETLEDADVNVTTKAAPVTDTTQTSRSSSNASEQTDANAQTRKDIEFVSLCGENDIKTDLVMLAENGEYFDVHYLEECEENSIPSASTRAAAAATAVTSAQKTQQSIRNRAEAKRSYECHACALEFRKRADFLTHRKTVHASKFPCPDCPKLLNTSDALRVHQQLHRGEPAYKCDMCQRTFNQKVHYKYHMDRHNNVRNFKCNHCHKAFLAKSDLSVHMRSHTGERPYECDICGKTYLILQHLKMHRYSHFDKSFECKICNQKFVSPSTLRTHTKTIHNTESRFQCEFCVKRFKRKHHLHSHYKMHQNPKTHDNINGGTVAVDSVDNNYQLVSGQLTEDCSSSADGFIKIVDTDEMTGLLVVDDDGHDAVTAESHVIYGEEMVIDIEEDVSVF